MICRCQFERRNGFEGKGRCAVSVQDISALFVVLCKNNKMRQREKAHALCFWLKYRKSPGNFKRKRRNLTQTPRGNPLVLCLSSSSVCSCPFCLWHCTEAICCHASLCVYLQHTVSLVLPAATNRMPALSRMLFLLL